MYFSPQRVLRIPVNLMGTDCIHPLKITLTAVGHKNRPRNVKLVWGKALAAFVPLDFIFHHRVMTFTHFRCNTSVQIFLANV